MSGLNNMIKHVDRETKQKVDNNPLLFHLRFLAMKDYHIELYKVLKESYNNKDNIFLLLSKRIRTNPTNKIEVEKALQALNDANSIVIDICDVRDKCYAHLDKDYEKYTSKKQYVVDISNLFYIIEMGIIALSSKEELNIELAKIESRNDYFL